MLFSSLQNLLYECTPMFHVYKASKEGTTLRKIEEHVRPTIYDKMLYLKATPEDSILINKLAAPLVSYSPINC